MGAVQAVVFDWAGTLVDFGSLAPTQIFVDAFATFGIAITLGQARGPMGVSKRRHIEMLLAETAIAQQWQAVFGRASTDADIDDIYARFMPMQIARVGEYSHPIAGAANTIGWLRKRGIRVGSCSGYPREVLDVLLPMAAAAGIAPDCVVAGDELPAGGRPGPFMALHNVIALGVGDVRACVKIDDTGPGIEEGRNAGMWTVGLMLSGNEVGYSLDALARASDAEIEARISAAAQRLKAAGAHYVIDTVADLPAVIEAIEARIAAGERP